VGTLNAGTAYNIVAETAVLEGTLRSFNAELRERIKGYIDEVAGHWAAAFGAGLDTEWKDCTSVLVNDPAVCGEVAETAGALAGKENVVTDRPCSLGGDDFAEFLLHVPGVYAQIGSGNSAQPDTVVPHHNGRFDIDESALVYAAGIYAEYALHFLAG
jgi:metal-dependent amidase/aminoacylase/carboxypeptidase family protein